jgi:hypothetical protein
MENLESAQLDEAIIFSKNSYLLLKKRFLKQFVW